MQERLSCLSSDGIVGGTARDDNAPELARLADRSRLLSCVAQSVSVAQAERRREPPMQNARPPLPRARGPCTRGAPAWAGTT